MAEPTLAERAAAAAAPGDPAGDLGDDPVDAAVREVLLRCWVRETGVAVPAGGPLRLDVGGRVLVVPVHRASPTGWHRFGVPCLDGVPVDAGGVAVALGTELADRAGRPPGWADDLVARTVDSLGHIRRHVALRVGEPAPVPPGFLDGEQGLVAGHPFHPAAKGREGWDDAQLTAYAPELRGALHLRWLAIDADLVVTGSAAGRPAGELLADLDEAPGAAAGQVAVPVHPWQAQEVLARPAVASLVERGAVRDLGEGGAPWLPTSSIRTVWRPGAAWMLKLSLGMRITNSRRDNLRAELRLGEQVHRLLGAGIADALAAAHPRFRIVTDPAWVGVDLPGGGLETAIRQNPFAADDPVVCVAALVDERPGLGGPLLADLVHRLARRSRRPAADVAAEWVGRYVAEVVAPLTWLDAHHGIVLEAHHQNTLVTLDRDGWPCGGWYRDSQGWYVAGRAEARLRRLVPGLGDGIDLVFDDDLVARRGAYYLGVNNLLGLVGALGAAGVAEEERLLPVVRAGLIDLPRSPVLDVLLTAPGIASKANLLTCADGRDELAGPVEHQSIYVEIPNPLLEAMT